MISSSWPWPFLPALLALSLAASAASAASSFSNALTGFTGNSTQSATQAAVAAAGFNFTSTAGAGEDPPGSGNFVDPTIQFDASGAHFGDLILGDPGRNFMRTVATDYANHSFVADVTWTTTDIFTQAAYFGLGSAEYGAFRIADWGTPFSAAHLFLEVNPTDPVIFTLLNDNTLVEFDAGTNAPGLDSGTNRLRLAYDWFRKAADFSIDVNYTGGAFTADVSAPSVNVLSLYGPDGWPSEPAKVYFGGDDGGVFKDFQVTVSTPSMRMGDFNMDGAITPADWMIVRTNQHTNLSGKTHSEAYFLGDLTADLANNHADFTAFKSLYDAANGDGAFEAVVSGVPEMATSVLLSSAAVLVVPVLRRSNSRKKAPANSTAT